MKFSHSIQFNAVPDWSDAYIAYSNLKKLIYTLEKEVLGGGGDIGHEGSDVEDQAGLLSARTRSTVDPDQIFTKALDKELDKIVSFYRQKESELFDDVRALQVDAANYQKLKSKHESDGSYGPTPVRAGTRRASTASLVRTRSNTSASGANDSNDSDDDEEGALIERDLLSKRDRARTSGASPSGSPSIDPAHGIRRRTSQSWEDYQDQVYHTLKDLSATLRKRIILSFVSLRELKSFSQLNKTGFTKACKKYDKILQRSLRATYLEQKVAVAYPFRKATLQELDARINAVEQIYADIYADSSRDRASRELRLHLREHVVWERNTVWRDMIGIERKAQAAKLGLGRTVLGAEPEVGADVRLIGDEPDISLMRTIKTPFGVWRAPKWLFSGDFFMLCAVLCVFATLLVVKTFKTPEQSNCFAMLVFVSLLWATEIIPLFVTSMLVPFLVVVLRVLRDDATGERLPAETASKVIFSAMWTPVIMLLLGGFTIAAALTKYDIAKLMATTVLQWAGTRPRVVLVTNMFVAMFISMWISNVAAPVLCYSLIEPLLRTLPSESKFPKPLIIGIALASNIGGMSSPIASPQNIIALQNMNPPPSWGEWFLIALPVSIFSILAIWVLLLLIYRPHRGTTIIPIRPPKDKFTGTQYFITLITLTTIVLWCISHQLSSFLGDMGVIAIIPLAAFFGTGILTKEDFNNFLWTIIMLAGGGLSLGKSVSSSGLLNVIAESIGENVRGMGVYAVLVVFSGIILVIATFISHTVAALIFLPIVAQVGEGMGEGGHPRLLVMGAAMCCSAAMGLPTSGFPNMTAIMMEHPATGRRYLRVKHFLHTGVPATLLSFGVIVTVGYGIMRVLDF